MQPLSPILMWMQALAFPKENKILESASSSCTRTLHPWQSQAERFSCLEALRSCGKFFHHLW